MIVRTIIKEKSGKPHNTQELCTTASRIIASCCITRIYPSSRVNNGDLLHWCHDQDMVLHYISQAQYKSII